MPRATRRGHASHRTAGPWHVRRAWWLALLPLWAACSGSTSGKLDCDAPIERWIDADGDGFGAADTDPETVCPNTAGYAELPLDCDDADPAVHPDATELCNGRDDDCNGELDNGLPGELYYTDADSDGHGVRYPAQIACADPGPGWSRRDDDCDDTRDNVHPGAPEVCNGGRDDDCNGLADDSDDGLDLSSTGRWHRDGDADGFGDPGVELRQCIAPAGFVADATDCDDGDGDVFPGADELPGDGIDENCNDLEGCYDDLDQDDARTETWAEVADLACTLPGHAAADAPLDCDDTDPSVNVDVTWFEDLDGDGYGSGLPVLTQCLDPGGDLVPQTEFLDCDDDDPDHSPATIEICDDGIDQNCDFRVDCDDPGCLSFPECVGPCVDISLPSDYPLTTNGNTTNQGNDLGPTTCAYSSAPDVVFQWAPPADGFYTIDLQGSAYDTVLYVLDGCGGAEIACNDDYFGLQSMVQVQGTAGQPLIIVVDGYSSGSGAFILNIQ